MKKLIVFLIVVVIVLSVILGIVSVNLYKITQANNQNLQYYGQRGNISTSAKIEFLSKNDELLTGMMGLEYSTEEVKFTEDEMTTFAVYVAKQRYDGLLAKEYISSGNYSDKIDIEIIDGIIKEFFGVTDILHSVVDNDYYSRSRGYFLIDEEFEKSMWFYPVNEEIIEVTETVDNEEAESDSNNENETENAQEIKTKNIVITADSIYIDETKEESEYKNIKYDGMYDETIVEYTIKFKYDENGKLISYQYIEK